MTQKQSVVIIGGGPAGLTAAWELVKDGGSEQYDVTVLEGNVDSFNDPGKGKEFALSMYNQGADFIQAIAGASGMGIYNGL